jgi:hypothetical protein
MVGQYRSVPSVGPPPANKATWVVSASKQQLGFEHFKFYVMYESSGTGAFGDIVTCCVWGSLAHPVTINS